MALRTAVFALTVLAGLQPAFAGDLVIESRAEGKNFNLYKETEGTWIDSNTPPHRTKSTAQGCSAQGTCGSRKFFFKGDANASNTSEPPAAARFSPNFTAPGHYHVYATWPSGACAMPVTYVIKHAGGTARVQVVQDGFGDLSGGKNCDKWIILGDYDFLAGPDQYVEVRAEAGIRATGDHYGQVYADALRFITDPIPSAVSAPTPDGTPFPRPVVQTPFPTRSSTPTPAPYTPPPSAVQEIKWYEDINTGFGLAQAGRKNVLLFFFTPDTASTGEFERIFSDPRVMSILAQKYVAIKLNFLNNTDLGYKLRVFKGGTVCLYDSAGNGLTQITDTPSVEEMLAKLQTY